MRQDKIHPDLRGLLAKLADDGLDAEDRSRLQQILADDPASRAFYRKYMVVEASLRWQSHSILRASSIAPAIITEPEDLCAVGDPISPVTASPVTASPVVNQQSSPVLGFLSDACCQTGAFLNRPTPFWMLMSAIVLIPLASLFTIVIVSSVQYDRMMAAQNAATPTVARLDASNRNNNSQSPPAEIPSIAYLERQSDDARWASPQSAAMMGIGLQPGRQLQLTAGLAEIAFESGAKVILQAPTTFLLDEENACSLEFGKISAYVPPEAKGFRVQSDGVTVVDLGTEFGMQVTGEADAEVHVFTGVVEALLTARDDDPPWPTAEAKPLRLEKDVALCVSSLAVTILKKPADPRQFVRKMPRSGVTDRPLIRNASFEFPSIDSSDECSGHYKPEFGNAWNLPIAGWEQLAVGGATTQPTVYQLSPYKSPRDATYDVGPGATDGRQVAVLCLRKEGSENGTVHENWIFQPLGEVVASDVGRTIELKADVAVREKQQRPLGPLGDGARGTVCFATDVTVNNVGTAVGNAGVDARILYADGVQTLTATLTVTRNLVGQTLFVRLSVANGDPESFDEQYHFDNVRCRAVEPDK